MEKVYFSKAKMTVKRNVIIVNIHINLKLISNNSEEKRLSIICVDIIRSTQIFLQTCKQYFENPHFSRENNNILAYMPGVLKHLKADLPPLQYFNLIDNVFGAIEFKFSTTQFNILEIKEKKFLIGMN